MPLPRCLATLAAALLLLALLPVPPALAQPDTLVERAPDPMVRSVELFRGTNPQELPVLTLGVDNQFLTLRFDHLDPVPGSFFVDLRHADADWRPSGLDPMAVYTGYPDDPIQNVHPSRGTAQPYVHYHYRFPQPGQRLLHSGNYLLRVYRDRDPSQVVLTRRFLVVEPGVSIRPEVGLSPQVRTRFTHQNVAFAIHQGSIQWMRHEQELKVQVLQNFRWDNAQRMGEPRFAMPDRLDYSFDAAAQFSGGNEFRLLDLRRLDQPGLGVAAVRWQQGQWVAWAAPGRSRANQAYLSEPDLNGGFVITSRFIDLPDADPYTMGEYVAVNFALQTARPLPPPWQVHLHGRLTSWQPAATNQLLWDPSQSSYVGTAKLKQGVYDYTYVAHNPQTGEVDERRFEGEYFETENNYCILVYYRGFGDRTDRLVGYHTTNFYED